MGLPVDGFPPPHRIGSVGRTIRAVVPNDPSDRRDQLVDVLVAEVDEARVGLADQVDEADRPRPVQDRGRRGGLPFASGLPASAHVLMLDHIGVISNAIGPMAGNGGAKRKPERGAATA